MHVGRIFGRGLTAKYTTHSCDNTVHVIMVNRLPSVRHVRFLNGPGLVVDRTHHRIQYHICIHDDSHFIRRESAKAEATVAEGSRKCTLYIDSVLDRGT